MPSGDTPGDWNAADYARDARFVADLAAPLVDLLDPRPGERILDLGCGDGVLSHTLVERGADVLGVDASPDLATAARERGIHAIVADGHALADCAEISGRFDAVFSNAALHWMKRDPQVVIDGVYQRLVPGGRFVAEFGGAGNVAPIQDALRAQAKARGVDPDTLDPWYFPTDAEYRQRLENAGFVVDQLASFERPTELPGDVSQWLTTLARPFVTAFEPGAARQDYVAAVRDRLVDSLQDEHGRWIAPYVRLRFVARRPAER
jgi:trans-aconitate methyltransferase